MKDAMQMPLENSVLQRKTRQSGETHRRNDGAGFGRALTRAADSELGVKLSLVSEDENTQDLHQLLSSAEGSMLLVLDGAEGLAGALLINRQFVSHIIAFLTIGSLGQTAERNLTRTDAAFLQPFVDTALKRFQASSGSKDGYQFGAFVVDAHSLGNLLEATRFAIHKTRHSVQGLDQPVEITCAFPLRPTSVEAPRKANQPAAISERMRDRLMGTRITAEVTLCKTQLSFEAVKSLAPEQVIEIPVATLGQAALTCGGEQIAEGTLGQFNGFRALKISGQSASRVYGPLVQEEPQATQVDPSTELVEVG